MNWKPLAALLVLAAVPLAAQQPARPEMMEGPMMREMGAPMMKMMLYAPQHLLARKDALDLTGDQVTRLTRLRDGSTAAHAAAMAEARAHMKELERVAGAGGAPQLDTTALKTHFQAAHSALGKAHWAMLASAAQARAVLTDAQRVKVQAWADSMQAWMQQHHEMMKPSQPH